MIDPKKLMEFFEKEYNIKFVDAETGKDALEVIAEREASKKIEAGKTCDTCRWGTKGDGKTVHKDDMVCTNDKSDHIANFVSKTDSCPQWEAKT